MTSFNIFLNYNVLGNFAHIILWAWDVLLSPSANSPYHSRPNSDTTFIHETVPNSSSALTKPSSLLQRQCIYLHSAFYNDHFALCYSYLPTSVFLSLNIFSGTDRILYILHPRKLIRCLELVSIQQRLDYMKLNCMGLMW